MLQSQLLMETMPSLQTAADMKREIKLLRSFVIGLVGKDKEGDYKPSFVKRIFTALQQKPTHTFTDTKSFLAHLKKTS